MSDKKNKKDEKNTSLNIKITIITAVIVVWAVCLALVLSKCDSSKKTEVPPVDETPAFTTYENTETGSVTKAESKTVAYFDSHFKDNYYRVKEIEVSSAEEGTYYITEAFAYTTDGYVYRKKAMATYDEMPYAEATVELLTPTNAYVIYPDMKAYFVSDGNSSVYKNTINFNTETFKTGTVDVHGIDYFYEEITDANGIATKYCYDKNDELKYTISTTSQGTVTEAYKEYSKDVDYSLFEIPDDYVLQQ